MFLKNVTLQLENLLYDYVDFVYENLIKRNTFVCKHVMNRKFKLLSLGNIFYPTERAFHGVPKLR